MNWLTELVEQHKELESPPSFWFWAGLSAISAVVKDSVWVDKQIYNLYPNIYTMIHAESGMKKGPPVSMAKQLVKQVNNTRIIGGRSSIQGILKEMGQGYTVEGKKPMTKSVAFICSSELSSSIVEDKVATKILTDLYDRQYNIGEWRSLLKMESFELKDPTVTMLTATNEAMSEDFFTRSAIQGGYFARTFIVYEANGVKSNSLIYPMKVRPNYPAAAGYLKELAKLAGPFKPLATERQDDEYKYKKIKEGREIFFNRVGLMYDDWYDDFKEMQKDMELKDDTGTLNRFGDSVLKVAMLLSLAEQATLDICESAMTQAVIECQKLLGNVRKTTSGRSGTSTSATVKHFIIRELLERQTHQISRTMLMHKLWTHYSSAEEFDELMNSLHAAGLITIQSVGNQILYTMPDKQVEEQQEFFKHKRGAKSK